MPFFEKGLSPQDLQQVDNHGIESSRLKRLLRAFQEGVEPVVLERPCTIGNGLVTLDARQQETCIALFRSRPGSVRALQFVPASGAASRMFSGIEAEALVSRMVEFAFYPALQKVCTEKGINLARMLFVEDIEGLRELILGPDGLGYGYLPKGMVKFHRYDSGSRSAFEEHLERAAGLNGGGGGDGLARVHFTLAPSRRVRDVVKNHIDAYLKLHASSRFAVGYSEQSTKTEVFAINEIGEVVRDEAGEIVFRPGGHGALLGNLQSLEEDVVFIRNVDNVCHASHVKDGLRFQQMMGGFLLQLQEEAFQLVRALDDTSQTLSRLGETIAFTEAFIEERLQVRIPWEIRLGSRERKVGGLRRILNRPIRVCGMVASRGHSGGKPFWVADIQGGFSKQIVEECQVDRSDPVQLECWESATHFNPVDMACGMRDYLGRKFMLAEFADSEAWQLTRKSHLGSAIQVLEYPGLWNGQMAGWITLFVEAPVSIFTPVKNVLDLLEKEHR